MAASAVPADAQSPQGTECTYQGFLTDTLLPATGQYDFEFTAYNAEIGGMIVGGPIELDHISVVNGLFTVELDFGGSTFAGDACDLVREVCVDRRENALLSQLADSLCHRSCSCRERVFESASIKARGGRP